MSRKNIVFMLSVVMLFFLWSSMYTAISLALQDFSPKGLALFRLLIASTLLFILSFKYKVRFPDKKDLPIIICCGVFGICVYNIVIMYGQKSTSVALSSLFLNTYPIFVSIFSFLIFKEYINVFKWMGIIVCFSGLIIASGCSGISANSSIMLFVFGAIILSLYDLEQKELMKKYTPFELTCYFFWAGTLALLSFSDSLINDFKIVKVNSLLSAVYLGVFPSIIASLLWAKMILKYSVSVMSCCCYISPIFAMLSAFLFLGQIPGESSIIGTAVVLSGLLIIHFSEKTNLRISPA